MPCKFPRGRWALQALFLFLSISAPAKALPPIEAKSFQVSLERKSNSGKILLLKSSGPLPGVNQLVLLRNEAGPLVALRTRRLYAERQFAGQIVRDYQAEQAPGEGASLQALVKIRDLMLDEEEITTQPPDDLDAELDRGRKTEQLSEPEELELRSLVVEEVEEFEQERWALLYRFALVRMPGFEEGNIYPAASGARFSRTILHPLLFSGARYQDSLGVDFSVLFTKLNDYTTTGGDSFAILPVTLSAKYTLYPSSGFGIYGYLGLMKNFILTSNGEDPDYTDAYNLLAFSQPVLGAGMTLEIGPQWWLQFDLGTDQLGFNLGLKF